MAKYRIVILADDSNINRVKKKAQEAFGADISHQVEKIDCNPSRSDRLSEAESLRDQAQEIVDDLKSEMEEWHGNLPQSLQDSDKGTAIQEAADGLSTLSDELSNIDFNSVEFPSAF